jgi:NAD(P)-dependent dehydrogenase (short-subunit alcohol dehydrogenase family)
MKVLVIGGSGTIGRAVVNELQSDSQIITASLHNGNYRVNLSNQDSIIHLFEQTGRLNAVICAASRGVVFKPVGEMTIDDYEASLQQKLLGQIRVALEAVKVLEAGGSITLTTGIMNRDFVAGGSAAAMVNNAVEGFVQAASLDMPQNIRINAVSPALLEESAQNYATLCPGFPTAPAYKVAKAYRRSVYGIQTGSILGVQSS